MSLTDKTLTCKECGASFAFTAEEQTFYSSRGFTNEPGRCPECRAARKARMGNSTGGYSSGGGGSYSRQPREMHPAVCASCGEETQVPFVPRGDRPVYCSRCYEKVRSYEGGRR